MAENPLNVTAICKIAGLHPAP